jgi:hypothetical protein
MICYRAPSVRTFRLVYHKFSKISYYFSKEIFGTIKFKKQEEVFGAVAFWTDKNNSIYYVNWKTEVL